MKGSGGLVAAVLVVLALATASEAGITSVKVGSTTTYQLTASSYGQFERWSPYEPGVTDSIIESDYIACLKYADISGILTAVHNGSVTVTSATFTYKRGWTLAADVQVPSSVYVTELTTDPATCTTGTLADKYIINTTFSGDAAHRVRGLNTCWALEASTGSTVNGPYAGFHSINISPIVASWASGVTNYGVGVTSVIQELVGISHYLPTLEITTVDIRSPEPTTMGLLIIGGISTLLRRRRIAQN